MMNMCICLCKTIIHQAYQSIATSNKFNNNSGLFLIMVMTLDINIVKSMQLATKYFNQSGEIFIAFNRKDNTALHREHADTAEIGVFKAASTRLVLENSYFIGDIELDKVFFASDPNLPLANVNNSLKVSLFSKNLKSTMNQYLNEVYYYTKKHESLEEEEIVIENAYYVGMSKNL